MTSTFVAGLAHDGIRARMPIDTPMTGLNLPAMADRPPHPEIQPGSIVVCENLPARKVVGIRQCLENAGMGLLYLPPYSPDFNPIEQMFAKVKALLRRAARASSTPSAMPSKPSLPGSSPLNAQTTCDTPGMCNLDRF